MIAVERPDLSGDAAWKAWNDKVTAAMDKVKAAYQPDQEVAISTDLYKGAMPFLLRVFNGKCAYCEVVLVNNQPGDVEHYRPKGRVSDDQGKAVSVERGGAQIPHPGYWWLAYEWNNLLPACTDCNRMRRHGDEREAAGKGDRFGIRGQRALLPVDPLADEDPLLLDPTTPGFDPSEHFEFHPNGMLKPKTPQAEYTCELLGLNRRERLAPARAKEFKLMQLTLLEAMKLQVQPPSSDLEDCRMLVNEAWAGRTPYSGFARRALDIAAENYRANTGRKLDLPL